jgi:hypothetical protein
LTGVKDYLNFQEEIMALAKKKVTKKPDKKLAPMRKKLIKEKTADSPSKPAAEKTSKVVEFTLYPSKSYSEEYQITGFHYAFMSSDNKMCHHWIKCRDFLQDALRNQLTGPKDQIYSFNYNPDADPKVETNKTLMLVKKSPTPPDTKGKKNFDEMMKSALQLVNHYEKAHNITPRSKIVKAKHAGTDQYVYLFQGPGVWSQGAIMIAIYTFLIRLGHFKPVFKDEASLMKAYEKIIADKSGSNDTKYLKTVYKNLHPALKNLDKHLFKKPGHKKGNKVLFHDSEMNSFHHHSGIVSLSQFNTPEKGLNDEFRKIFAEGK